MVESRDRQYKSIWPNAGPTGGNPGKTGIIGKWILARLIASHMGSWRRGTPQRRWAPPVGHETFGRPGARRARGRSQSFRSAPCGAGLSPAILGQTRRLQDHRLACLRARPPQDAFRSQGGSDDAIRLPAAATGPVGCGLIRGRAWRPGRRGSGPGRVLPRRDGGDARRREAGHRRLPAGRRRPRAGRAETAGHPHPDALQQGQCPEPRPLLRRARLRLRRPGHARALQVGRGVALDDRRRPGRLRHRRLAREATVVQRPVRDDRHVVRGRNAARHGDGQRPWANHGDPGRRGVQHGLPRDAQRRGVRAAVLELDPRHRRLQGKPPGPRSRHSGRAGGTHGESPGVSDVPPAPPRHHAAEARAGVRGLAGRGHAPWRQRRLLEAEQHRRLPRKVQGHPRVPGGRVVRFVGRQHHGQLRGAEQATHQPGVPDHGPVDPRRPEQLRTRSGGLQSGRRHCRSFGVALGVVRPVAEGDRQRGGQEGAVRHARADLRHGHRRRAQDAGGPAVSRRLLARRARVASGPHALHALLSPRRRRALPPTA